MKVNKGLLIAPGDVVKHRVALPTVPCLVKDVQRLQVLEFFCVLLFETLVEEVLKASGDVNAAPTTQEKENIGAVRSKEMHTERGATYEESMSLCSGGPRWAKSVTILSKGLRPIAFRSRELDR